METILDFNHFFPMFPLDPSLKILENLFTFYYGTGI